ncbi:MAG TPA: diheme cytochrome c precursor [Pirellulaceae bacterium]|nr:diheme cytochrome c precursor [Pirellulaceae bacterium]HMO92388.1 diheme cytochrome c precursor [Pirellulaceae bacterium]HMP69508.1 diheme cytochrome c precursor [Pirellulaceae bacterium]
MAEVQADQELRVFEPLDPNSKVATSRAVQLALAAVVGIALVGFVVGIRQGTPIPELVPPSLSMQEPAHSPDAIAATAYRDFNRRNLGANRGWSSQLADLEQPNADLMADYTDFPVRDALSEAQRTAFVAQRKQRRAFDGAPPVVPHPIDQMTSSSCLACHQNGLAIGPEIFAPQMSHPLYANCTQCHAEGASIEFGYHPLIENHFQGNWPMTAGARAFDAAPPTIPHPTWMRENCMSCHGVAGANPIRTSHPWRASCTQCHAPSSELDQFHPIRTDR